MAKRRGPGDDGWQPEHGAYSREVPTVGTLLAWDHEVWRVLAVNPYPEDRWRPEDREHVEERGRDHAPLHLILRPSRHDSPDPVAARSRDRSVTVLPGRTVFWVIRDEHFPVCARCQEPLPCRHRFAEKAARAAMADMRLYEMPGVCPSCQEPVSSRQKSLTFPDNIIIPGGPPVTFHTRWRCHWRARRYEDAWVAADPERRRTSLTCPGKYTQHCDDTYECSELNECRGPDVVHRGGSVTCGCPDCRARGWTGWIPRSRRRQRRRDAGGG